jgi:hypothetical protein
MTIESPHDLPGITSQIYDSDNSQPTGTDMQKAPQCHHLKNASCVTDIPHLGMFMAITVINSNKFQERVNDTAPRDRARNNPHQPAQPGLDLQ